MKKLIVPLFISILLIVFSSSVFAAEPVTYQTQSIKFSGGTRQVNAIYVNMNDKNIRVESRFAKNQVGQTDDFTKIVAQAKDSDTEILAAVNGTFFNSYSDMKPTGTIQKNGRFYHVGSNGSVIAFSSDNKVSVETLRASIKGAVNEDWEDPSCSWYAWNINSMNNDKNSIIIFDPAFGKSTPAHDRTSIVIDSRTVTAIRKGQTAIPANGYVIVLQDTLYINKFHIGDKVDYRIETSSADSAARKTPIDWSSVVTSIGAGPTLLKNGTVIANGKSEGFTENKINTDRGQRSFAGVTKNNTLIIGTVANVNIKELAEICKKLGMINAINLDGGASSALYFKGKTITSPGRKLSNVMVVTRVKDVPPRYSLNGKEVIPENSAYVDPASQELMLPLKDTCSRLYADYSVKSSDITVKRFTKTINMKLGKNSANIDGNEIALPAAAVSKGGIIYVPVHAFIEALGGNVSYDAVKKMYAVTITNYNIPDLYRQATKANTSKNYAAAKKLYNQILSLKPEYFKVYYNLGYLCSNEKNPDEALKNFLEYLKYNPEDAAVMSAVARIYDGKGDNTNTAGYFEKSLSLEPSNVSRLISAGQFYMRYTVANYDRALECFKNALDSKPTEAQKAEINKSIAECKKRRGS